MNRIALILIFAAAAAAAGAAAAEPSKPAAGGYSPPPAKSGHSYPECYCTDSRGARVEVGETACLQIGSRQVTSRCEKARNLVIWRHQSEGCAPGV
ncbi:MAG: hypothetical protein ACFBSD_11200 [Paracoccaceae bacterium]